MFIVIVMLLNAVVQNKEYGLDKTSLSDNDMHFMNFRCLSFCNMFLYRTIFMDFDEEEFG